MRAVVQDRFGPPDVLELREVERPEAGDALRHLGEGHARGKLVVTV